jgi:hypothetical protein
MPQPAFRVGIFDDGAWLKPAIVNFNSGSAVIVPQATNIWKLVLMASASTNISFMDGASPLSGAMSMVVGVPIILQFDSKPWATCQTNFTINQSASAQVSGIAYYT